MEAFWESGAPRFGESGAKGWTSWVDGNSESQRFSSFPSKNRIDSK